MDDLLALILSGWLMVSLDCSSPPAVFRVINEAWALSCDEVSGLRASELEMPSHLHIV